MECYKVCSEITRQSRLAEEGAGSHLVRHQCGDGDDRQYVVPDARADAAGGDRPTAITALQAAGVGGHRADQGGSYGTQRQEGGARCAAAGAEGLHPENRRRGRADNSAALIQSAGVSVRKTAVRKPRVFSAGSGARVRDGEARHGFGGAPFVVRVAVQRRRREDVAGRARDHAGEDGRNDRADARSDGAVSVSCGDEGGAGGLECAGLAAREVKWRGDWSLPASGSSLGNGRGAGADLVVLWG